MSGAKKSAETVCWYAIQIRPRCEKKTDSNLQNKGIETFLPLVRGIHRWSDRNRVVETPLFSGYSFVHLALTAQERLRVLQTSGVLGIAGTDSQPAAVPDTQVEGLRRLLETGASFAVHPFLRAGQRVRIRGGALDGMEAILHDPGKGRTLVLSIESIQRSLALQIEGYEIEVM
jgi:transcriptional antiterminator RfaH